MLARDQSFLKMYGHQNIIKSYLNLNKLIKLTFLNLIILKGISMIICHFTQACRLR